LVTVISHNPEGKKTSQIYGADSAIGSLQDHWYDQFAACPAIFIGYDIDEPEPWHSTLSRTRQL
jgi:hypothetical protein